MVPEPCLHPLSGAEPDAPRIAPRDGSISARAFTGGALKIESGKRRLSCGFPCGRGASFFSSSPYHLKGRMQDCGVSTQYRSFLYKSSSTAISNSSKIRKPFFWSYGIIEAKIKRRGKTDMNRFFEPDPLSRAFENKKPPTLLYITKQQFWTGRGPPMAVLPCALLRTADTRES